MENLTRLYDFKNEQCLYEFVNEQLSEHFYDIQNKIKRMFTEAI